MKLKKGDGFTLIELLVVVAIIGILASIVIASLNSARKKARDSRRLSDIHQIENALELYFNTNFSYPLSTVPLSPAGTSPNTSWRNSIDAGSWALLEASLAPYISELPTDPKQSDPNPPNGWAGAGNANYGYAYYACASGFMLVYQLEIGSGPDLGAVICGSSFKYGGAGANTTVKTVTVN